MFRKFRKYIRLLKDQEKNFFLKKVSEKHVRGEDPVEKALEINLSILKKKIGKSSDMILREFNICAGRYHRKALIYFVDGLVDNALISDYIAKILSLNIHTTAHDEQLLSQDVFILIKGKVVNAASVKEIKTFDEVIMGALSGEAALFIDGYQGALGISVGGAKGRNVEESQTEITIRGPREGFNENLRVNTALVRKRIKSPKLVFESFKIGKQTHTEVEIGYIEDIVNKKIVEEVKYRLDKIDTDAVLESGYIEQLIEDHPLSPFATIGNSEKPDKVAAKLLEGRVAIFCEGTPIVLTIPYLFIEALQSTEDYYSRPFFSSINRMLRFLSFLITLLTPALYVALSTFHQEMIPAVLLFTMTAAREGIPFPTFIEAMLMGIVFEILRESGARMPRPVGQAVSIVGGLVIGQVAVSAGVVGDIMVVITALTGICSFVVPALIDSAIVFRFILILMSAFFGLYGVAIGLMIMLAHMCSLRSFGAPYLAPIAPVIWKELKDSFIRLPMWVMQARPKSISWKSSHRQDISSMPKRPDEDKGDEDL